MHQGQRALVDLVQLLFAHMLAEQQGLQEELLCIAEHTSRHWAVDCDPLLASKRCLARLETAVVQAGKWREKRAAASNNEFMCLL